MGSVHRIALELDPSNPYTWGREIKEDHGIGSIYVPCFGPSCFSTLTPLPILSWCHQSWPWALCSASKGSFWVKPVCVWVSSGMCMHFCVYVCVSHPGWWAVRAVMWLWERSPRPISSPRLQTADHCRNRSTPWTAGSLEQQYKTLTICRGHAHTLPYTSSLTQVFGVGLQIGWFSLKVKGNKSIKVIQPECKQKSSR